ncbi:MAG TPA: hypothetical protein VIV54_07180 [Burkholderiales bacterium]
MSAPQSNWDTRAALNFICGGAGSGLLIVEPIVHPLPSPAATVLALLLIATGLTAVWLEIGKPLRALHVFFNPFTSWMTRESLVAVLVFVLGAGALLEPRLGGFAAVAAAAFLWCQANILHASKGIPAWRAHEVIALIVTTGLAEGAGLALVFAHDPFALAIFAAALVARWLAWRAYRGEVRSPALEPAGRDLLRFGTAAALALALAALLFTPAAWLAGLTALATGWRLKHALVTRASHKQEFALPHVPVRGTR